MEQLRRAIDRSQHADLDDHADDADDQPRQQDRTPKTDHARQHLHQRIAEIGAQHVERPVGKIHHPCDAKDQRQPRGNHEERTRIGKPSQNLCDKKAHGHLLILGRGSVLPREPPP